MKYIFQIVIFVIYLTPSFLIADSTNAPNKISHPDSQKKVDPSEFGPIEKKKLSEIDTLQNFQIKEYQGQTTKSKEGWSNLTWKDFIAFLALVLSSINIWYNFLRKGKPIFACTKWTAVQMLENNQPRATFAVQISIYNKGKVPIQIYDFVLQAKSNDGQHILYQAIVLWDLRQWIEDGNRPDKVGRTQKGQVPLPLIISPGQLYDFSYPILFLPIDKTTLINPKTANSVSITVFSRTDRSKNYCVIGKQNFTDNDLKAVLTNSFSSVISTESLSKREILLKKITAT